MGTAVCEDMVCNHANPAVFLVFKDCMGDIYGMVHSVPFSSNFGEFHAHTTTELWGPLENSFYTSCSLNCLLLIAHRVLNMPAKSAGPGLK